MKKKHIVLMAIALVLAAGLTWVIWGNVTVGLTEYTVVEENLPAAFDGYRIAHVSDLHNSHLWEKAIQRLKEAQPDIICITGDIVDASKTDISVAFSFVEAAVRIAPCYYITGNHEPRIGEYEALLQGLRDRGVIVLMDEEVMLSRGNDEISLLGHQWGDTDQVGELTDFDGYRILLSHDPDPEEFANYVRAEYDLVLSGHLHGGQFRIPFVGGLYVPSQGLFPENDAGICTEGSTDMVVSRGIGNSVFPVRINNRPEVILIELQCA